MKVLKNCPNCGGILDNEGRCMYCKSKIYDLTGIKIDMNTKDIVLLRFEVEDKEIIYSVRPVTASIEHSISDWPRINIEFTGNPFQNEHKAQCAVIHKNVEAVILNEMLETLKEKSDDERTT